MRTVPLAARSRLEALVTKRLAPLALCIALLGACGDSSPKPPPGQTTTTTSTSLALPGSVTTPDAPGVTTVTTRRGTGVTTSTPSTTGTRDNAAAIAQAADAPPGAFAGVLLAPGPAQSIELDVLVQPGAAADASVLARIVALLKQQSGKPVTMTGPRPIAGGNVYSAEQIRDMADESGTRQGHDNAAVVHLLYLRGQYERDGVLGITVRGDTTALFVDEIAGAATPLVGRARLERSVVTHETGHILGLVDLFLATKRGDPDHPGHSRNPQSVMYWAVEADVVAQVLGGPPPVDFDRDDLADLARMHAGATS